MLVPTDANSDATTAMAAKLMLDNPTKPAKPSPNAHAATPKASASAMLSTVGEAAMAVVETLALTACTAASALLSPCAMSPAKHELQQLSYITYLMSHLCTATNSKVQLSAEEKTQQSTLRKQDLLQRQDQQCMCMLRQDQSKRLVSCWSPTVQTDP